MKKESELRQATILFADISGFTAMSEKMSPEEITSIMNSVFKMMGEIIKRYNGRIDKFIGDCVMATFGVPTATENAPQKAVNTAIEMRNKLYQFNREKDLNIPLDIHIGINSGNVLAGEVGSDDKKEYTVMGDTVNLAARLEDASQTGQILVGPDTHRTTKGEFEYRELKPIKMKGKEKPVPVFELISEKEKIHRRLTTDRMIQSEMVGRETEMDKLELAVAHTKNGEGSIVNVIGEAGIGKSRLIAELKNSDVVKRTTVLEGRALSMGRNLSFYPIIEILKSFAGINEDDSDSVQLQKLELAIRNIHPEETDEITPFIATLMGLQLSGIHTERVYGIEGESMEKLIFRSLRTLILKSIEIAPLIFIIEDLHWADTSSIELIISLCPLAENNSLLFINVFRPYYADTGELFRKAILENHAETYVEINLHRLNTLQSDILIDNLLRIEGLPVDLRSLIKSRSEGNPFFIEEMIRSLIDEGAVELYNGKFTITDKINSVAVPHTIQELLMSRIDMLDERTKSLIRNASVIGRHFFHKILTEVAETVEDIDNKLEYLKEVQLIREGKRMEEVEYLFKHALAQEATYESILKQKRKEIHLSVANAIERIFNERLHEFYGTLAYHYSQGEDLDKVEEYMLKAGEEAMKASASSEVITYYQKSLEIYSKKMGSAIDRKDFAGLEMKLGFAFLARGNHVEAIEHYQKALNYLNYSLPKSNFLLIALVVKNMLVLLKNIYFTRKSSTKTPPESIIQIAEIGLHKGKSLAVVDTKRFFLESICFTDILFKYDIRQSQSMFDFSCGFPMLFSFTGISFSLGRKALDYIGAIKDSNKKQLTDYYYDLAEIIHGVNSGVPDIKINIKKIDQAIKDGDFFAAAGSLVFLGLHVIESGDLEMINTIISKSEEIGNEYNYDHARMDFNELKSILLIKRKKLSEAEKYLTAGENLAIAQGQQSRQIGFLGLSLSLRVAQFDHEDAQKIYEQARELVRELGKISIPPYDYAQYSIAVLSFHLYKLQISITENDKSSINHLKKNLIKLSKDAVKAGKKFAPIRTESFRLMGLAHWHNNKKSKALLCFEKSIKEGERLGYRLELSRTYFEVGKRLLESKYKQLDGITAEEYLEKARVLFEEMDLQWDLEQLRKVNIKEN